MSRFLKMSLALVVTIGASFIILLPFLSPFQRMSSSCTKRLRGDCTSVLAAKALKIGNGSSVDSFNVSRAIYKVFLGECRLGFLTTIVLASSFLVNFASFVYLDRAVRFYACMKAPIF